MICIHASLRTVVFTSCESFLHLRQQSELSVRDEGQSAAGVVCSRRPTQSNTSIIRVWLISELNYIRYRAWRSNQPAFIHINWISFLPSNSMNVGLDSWGEIEVYDIGDILEIHTSGNSELLIFPLKNI